MAPPAPAPVPDETDTDAASLVPSVAPITTHGSASSNSLEFKIVVVGGGGVGKSALTINFVRNRFVEQYDPTIEDSYRKQLVVDGQPVVLNILDTAGQEEFSAMRAQYIRKGQGFVLVYSVTQRETFTELPVLYSAILQGKDCSTVPLVLVANKIDLPNRQVLPYEGEQQAISFNATYVEASAKTRQNVDKIFEDLVRLMRKNEKPVAQKQKRKLCFIL